MNSKSLHAVLFAVGMFVTGLAVGYLGSPSGGTPEESRPSASTLAQSPGNHPTNAESSALSVSAQSTPGEVAGRLLTATTSNDFFKRAHDIYEIVHTLDVAGVKNALEDSEKFGPYGRDWVRPQLVARWVELDPDGAFEWTTKVPTAQRSRLMREFFESLGLKHPQQIVGFLAKDKPNARGGDNYTSDAFAAWATHSPSDAADAASRLEKPMRDTAFSGVFRRWAQSNPQEALLRLQGMGDAAPSAIGTIFNSWADRDLTAAANAASAISDPGKRSDALKEVLSKAAQRDLSDGLRMLETLPMDERRRIAERISRAGYYDNPRFAAELYKYLPASRQRSGNSQLAYQLARVSPQEAVKWAEGLLSEEARKDAQRNIIIEWGSADPKAAFEYALQTQPTENLYSNTAFSRWSQTDPESAWEWLQKIPDSQNKKYAVSSVISSLARKDPQRAIREAATIAPDQQSHVMSNIASVWVSKDPDAALKWVASLPENTRYESASGAIATLARTKKDEAANWLKQQSDTKLRDYVTVNFSRTIAEDDPEAGIAWAKSISSEAHRKSAMNQITQRWKKDDPKAFAAWEAKGNTAPEPTRRQP